MQKRAAKICRFLTSGVTTLCRSTPRVMNAVPAGPTTVSASPSKAASFTSSDSLMPRRHRNVAVVDRSLEKVILDLADLGGRERLAEVNDALAAESLGSLAGQRLVGLAWRVLKPLPVHHRGEGCTGPFVVFRIDMV